MHRIQPAIPAQFSTGVDTGIRAFTIWGSVSLLVAALASLYSIYERHRQYVRWLTIQDHGDPGNKVSSSMDRASTALAVAAIALPVTFLVGIALLVVAHMLSI